MSLFHDLVAGFQDREDSEAALQLLLDRPLMRYCALWRPTLVTLVNYYPLNDDWNALWDCVEVDYKRVADLADEPEGRARYQINRLRELRLIYPDGLKASTATRVIAKFLNESLA